EFRQMEETICLSIFVSSPSKHIADDVGEEIVPVLSNTTVSIAAICSMAAVFFIYNLFLSKILSAADKVNGELNANAHGQAIINTAVNAPQALSAFSPNIQNKAAISAIEINATVKYL